MMTPDKDYGQLVKNTSHIYKPAFMGKPAEKLGVKEVLERWNRTVEPGNRICWD